jgi:hypothetical protein
LITELFILHMLPNTVSSWEIYFDTFTTLA